MTIALAGNAAGGALLAGGAPAVNVSTASGLPFMKNKLINGEVTRINQRGVANWAAVASGAYGYDRWKKVDASNMTQIIEAGNFRPNTVHTLSGIGVTTQQITSPASGDWTLPNIPIAATNVQVEEGLEATPFEVRHVQQEYDLCRRYFQRVGNVMPGMVYAANAAFVGTAFSTPFRATPAPDTGVVGSAVGAVILNGGGTAVVTSVALGAATPTGAYYVLAASGLTAGQATLWVNMSLGLTAEL